jgi:hypothetical protein
MAVVFPDTHDELRHALAPARGIMIGLVLSAVLWVLVALIAFEAMHL